MHTIASSYVSKWQMHQTWNINNLPKSGQILLRLLFFDPVGFVSGSSFMLLAANNSTIETHCSWHHVASERVFNVVWVWVLF